jgi:hypothetical protein
VSAASSLSTGVARALDTFLPFVLLPMPPLHDGSRKCFAVREDESKKTGIEQCSSSAVFLFQDFSIVKIVSKN